MFSNKDITKTRRLCIFFKKKTKNFEVNQLLKVYFLY